MRTAFICKSSVNTFWLYEITSIIFRILLQRCKWMCEFQFEQICGFWFREGNWDVRYILILFRQNKKSNEDILVWLKCRNRDSRTEIFYWVNTRERESTFHWHNWNICYSYVLCGCTMYMYKHAMCSIQYSAPIEWLCI